MSVIIVTYNSGGEVSTCLRALLADGVRGDQILIWDNASADDSCQAAASCAPTAAVHSNAVNVGFAAAVNAAAALRPGRDLMLVNPDAAVAPGTVGALDELRGSSLGIAVAGVRLVDRSGSPEPDAWTFPTPRRTIAGSILGFGRVSKPRRVPGPGAEMIVDGFTPFTCALLRRSTFDALSGFDERFWLYGEDADFCYRVNRLGQGIAVATTGQAAHVGGASSAESERVRWQLAMGSLYRHKHFSPVSACLADLAMKVGAGARVVARPILSRVGLANPGSGREWQLVWRYRGGLCSRGGGS